MKKRIIYKDEVFGNLTVVETTDNKNVLCICKCGRLISVLKSNLTAGKSQSCGKGPCQSLFKDLTGHIINDILILELAGSDKDHGALWKCLCFCGKEFTTRGNSLRNGRTKSCGCQSGSLISKALSLPPGQINVNQLFWNYKNGAQNRDLNFSLSLEEFKFLVEQNCHYCGSIPATKNMVKNVSQENIIFYNGIDRIDNNLGYDLKNCLTACKICNFAKRDMSYDEFLQWIDGLVKYRQNLSEREINNNTESMI